MTNIVNRDTDAMRQFAASLDRFCLSISSSAQDLLSSCFDASDMMRDDSGQQAIHALESLVKDIMGQIDVAERVAENLRYSAKLVEESEALL